MQATSMDTNGLPPISRPQAPNNNKEQKLLPTIAGTISGKVIATSSLAQIDTDGTVPTQETLQKTLEATPIQFYDPVLPDQVQNPVEKLVKQFSPIVPGSSAEPTSKTQSNIHVQSKKFHSQPTQYPKTVMAKNIFTATQMLAQRKQLGNHEPTSAVMDLMQEQLDTMQDIFQDHMEEQLKKHSLGRKERSTEVDSNISTHPTETSSITENTSQIAVLKNYPATEMNNKHMPAFDTLGDSHYSYETVNPVHGKVKSGYMGQDLNTTQLDRPQMAFFERRIGDIGVKKTRIVKISSTIEPVNQTKMSPQHEESTVPTIISKEEMLKNYTTTTTTTPVEEEEEEEEEEIKIMPYGPQNSTFYETEGSPYSSSSVFSIHSENQHLMPSLAYGVGGEIEIERISKDITSTVTPWEGSDFNKTSVKETMYFSMSLMPSRSESISSSSIASVLQEQEETTIQPLSTLPIFMSATMINGEDAESEEPFTLITSFTIQPTLNYQTESLQNTLRTMMHISSQEQIEVDNLKSTSKFVPTATNRIQSQSAENEIEPTRVNEIFATLLLSSTELTSNEVSISTNQSRDAKQQGETTKPAPKESNLNVSATFGIVAGCLIAVWIIIGPIICLLLRFSEKKKEKNRKLRAEMNRDSKENCIMEAMIMSELGRDVASMNKFKIEDIKNDKSCDYAALAKDRSELENLKMNEEVSEAMLP